MVKKFIHILMREIYISLIYIFFKIKISILKNSKIIIKIL